MRMWVNKVSITGCCVEGVMLVGSSPRLPLMSGHLRSLEHFHSLGGHLIRCKNTLGGLCVCVGSESEWAPIWGEGEAGRAYMASLDLILWTAERASNLVTGCTCDSWVGLKSDSSMTLHPARDSVHHFYSIHSNKRQLRGHVGVNAISLSLVPPRLALSEHCDELERKEFKGQIR